MKALQIVDAVREMPLTEKLLIIELIFKDIKEDTLEREKEEQKRKKAAQMLLRDYLTNEKLTEFTVLDKDDFYEAN